MKQEKLKIYELEDELQVANRCIEDARERIKELEHENKVLTAINKEKVRIIKELKASKPKPIRVEIGCLKGKALLRYIEEDKIWIGSSHVQFDGHH